MFVRRYIRSCVHSNSIVIPVHSSAGRIHVDKDALITEVNKNGGKVIFDLDAYIHWKETETTANVVPDVPQKVRPRFKPVCPGSGRPPFQRVETETTSPEYRLENMKDRLPPGLGQGSEPAAGLGHRSEPPPPRRGSIDRRRRDDRFEGRAEGFDDGPRDSKRPRLDGNFRDGRGGRFEGRGRGGIEGRYEGRGGGSRGGGRFGGGRGGGRGRGGRGRGGPRHYGPPDEDRHYARRDSGGSDHGGYGRSERNNSDNYGRREEIRGGGYDDSQQQHGQAPKEAEPRRQPNRGYKL